ncbi:MAG: Carboxypeptidase precursor [Planctomycetota bacterium]|jgi:glutamate carboxypeptidase
MNLMEFQSSFSSRQPQFLEILQSLVEMESPSGDCAALNEVCSHISRLWEGPDRFIERISGPTAGDHLKIRWNPSSIDPQIKPFLVIGHFDTVWPIGTLKNMPFRCEGNKVFGPGTYDMKADIVLALLTVQHMQAIGLSPARPVVFLWTCDEEVGSQTSRSLIEEEAQNAFAALVLEPPLGTGALKTARKGVGAFRLEVKGRSAHAGIEPEKGRSATVELAHQILKINALSRPELGTTLNIGRIGGPTTNNVVPEHAWCEIDARVSTMEEAARLEHALYHDLANVDPDTSLKVTGGLNRPPMVRNHNIAQLFAQAEFVAKQLGVNLEEGSTGGGSDGNFTAAAGCPTLDGLGLEGAGAHAPYEHIRMESLPFRAALLAGLLSSEFEFA